MSYPPIEIVLVDESVREETDIRIITTMEVVEFSWETDIIDSPIGGGDAGDPDWGEYLVEESIGCLA